MASPSSSRAPTVRAWALLDRTPRLGDLAAMGISEADVLVYLVEAPAISTAVIDVSLHPAAAAAAFAFDDAAQAFRVEGADASGRLLLAFPSPRAPGESHLVACRLVVSTDSDTATATGKARPLPEFPEEDLGLALSPAARAGIISANDSGDAYFIALTQGARSSAPTSAATALCFSSEDHAWSVVDIPGDPSWRRFAATHVVSHDRGVRGDGGCLVFVDYRRGGILLFHPRRAAASRFVELPAAAHGGGGGEAEATVDSSKGKIIYATLSGMWSLSEQDLRWTRVAEHSPDEVTHCDARVALHPVRRIGPVHPNHPNRFFVLAGSSSFALDVNPKEDFSKKVSVRDMEDCTAVCQSSLVLPLYHDPTRTWLQDAKHVARLTMALLRKARKQLPKVAPALEVVGAAFNLPFTTSLVTAVKAIEKVDSYIDMGEKLVKEHRPIAPPPPWQQVVVVATEEEARRAIRVWEVAGKPADMTVDPASTVTPAELESIRKVFKDEGAETLLNSGFVVVDRALRWF